MDAKNLGFQLDEHRGSSSFPEAYFQIAFAVIVYYISWILDYRFLLIICFSFPHIIAARISKIDV